MNPVPDLSWKGKGEEEMEGTRGRGGGRASERKLGEWGFWFERRRNHVEGIRLWEKGGIFPPKNTASKEKFTS